MQYIFDDSRRSAARREPCPCCYAHVQDFGAPALLFLLLGGVAVDRWPRVPLMLASDLARGGVVSGVAVLAAAGRLEIWQVYVASVVFGFVDAFFQPAYTATVPALLPPEALPSANSLTSLSVQTGRVAGPALGAALVAAGGTPLAFALNGASFFLSAACLLPLLGAPAPRAPGEAPASVIGDLREGFATVRAVPWLLITISLAALGNILLAGPYGVALPFLVKDHLHAGVGTLGLLYALFPAGYILGSLWLGGKTRLRRRGPTAYVGLLVAGLMILGMGLPVPLAVLAGAALLNGVGLEVFGLIWTNTLQELVPPAQLGRVASIDLLGSYALLPVGYALARLGDRPVRPRRRLRAGWGAGRAARGARLAAPADPPVRLASGACGGHRPGGRARSLLAWLLRSGVPAPDAEGQEPNSHRRQQWIRT